MKNINYKIFFLLFLFFAKKAVAQQNDTLIKEPNYIINTIYYFDSEIMKRSGSSGVIVGNALVEIKNNTANDLPVPSLHVDAAKYLLLTPHNIKSGASIFYNVKWDAAVSESPPLLLYMALPEEEVSQVIRKESSSYYHSGFRTRGFDLEVVGDYEIDERYKTNNRYGFRSFKCPECLQYYYLMPVDTLVNRKDTSLLKNKYSLYNVVNNFYVLYDSVQKNAFLADFYTNTWKPNAISSKDIEVQTEKFMYAGDDENKKVFALIKITNHSKDYLYINEKINVPDNLGYKLSYFGQETEEKKRTINALVPKGTLVVKLDVDYDKFKNGYIDLILNTLFINCPNMKRRINFTPGYFIDPKTK